MGKPLRWLQEINRFIPVRPHFVLWGNVHDIYPFFADPDQPPVTLRLRDYLKSSLLQTWPLHLVVEFTPLIGFRLLHGDGELFKKITGDAIAADKPVRATLVRAIEIIEKLVAARETHVALILNLASRYRLLEKEETLNEFMFRMSVLAAEAPLKLCKEAGDTLPFFDPVFWIVDRENEVPDWYVVNNMRVRSIGLPRPDNEMRRHIIGALCRNMPGFAELPPEKQRENVGLFIDQTAGLFAGEIISIVQLARHEKIAFGEVGEAIKRYRVGVTENPWAKLDMAKIGRADELLRTRVRGQDHAITKAVEIVRRAVYNLSGSQYSRYSLRPKGILFFAGPTGVGKTELAKAITELLFGSDSSYLRFDMSEFGHEHADQRLLGAPPGYVGYDAGGQLTNAVRQNPFSVILFDEIEKAHPKILDIFLQILDDGRLTSGRGETVYFTESLIVFTSNLGIYEMRQDGTKVQRVSPDMQYGQIRDEVLTAIHDFFKFKISRPEILNRIGENIVVFDFIRAEVAGAIVERMVGNITAKLQESHGISLVLPPQTRAWLTTACCQDLSMGGRGIGNKIELHFLNPLSSALFAAGVRDHPVASSEIPSQTALHGGSGTATGRALRTSCAGGPATVTVEIDAGGALRLTVA